MSNSYFRFKEFTVYQERCAMKVTTDACLFGAWCATILQKNDTVKSVLDIGTGTGLLSLFIAQKNDVHIDAVEIEAAAAEQAKENCAASPWAKRLTVLHEDILQFTNGMQYDCVVSNPPFYENELKSGKQAKDLAHHSQSLTIPEVVAFVKTSLTATGVFFLLLPYKRLNEVEQLIRQQDLFIVSKVIVKQSPGHQPFRAMLMGSKENSVPVESAISIRNEAGEYSNEFISLLKDYYLYLY
jgi:tRNA1Val (adenine37-N6)-methyltransferase